MLPLLLRLGGSPAATQGGFKTPLPNWNAGGTGGVTQGGFITPLPFWNAGGGVGQDPVAEIKGGQERWKRPPPTKERKDLDDFFIEKPLEEVLQDVFTTGTATVGDTEIHFDSVPVKPELPISRLAPELSDIRDDVEREIAELIRMQQLLNYETLLKKYEEDVTRFEEEFIVFLMLME